MCVFHKIEKEIKTSNFVNLMHHTSRASAGTSSRSGSTIEALHNFSHNTAQYTQHTHGLLDVKGRSASFTDWDPAQRRRAQLSELTRRCEETAAREQVYTNAVNRGQCSRRVPWRDSIVLDLSTAVEEQPDDGSALVDSQPPIMHLDLSQAMAPSNTPPPPPSAPKYSSRALTPTRARAVLLSPCQSGGDGDRKRAESSNMDHTKTLGRTVPSPIRPSNKTLSRCINSPAVPSRNQSNRSYIPSPIRPWEPRGQYSSTEGGHRSPVGGSRVSPPRPLSPMMTAEMRCKALYEDSRARDQRLKKHQDDAVRREMKECSFRPHLTPYRGPPVRGPTQSPPRVTPVPSPRHVPVATSVVNALIPLPSTWRNTARSVSGGGSLAESVATSIATTNTMPLLYLDVTVGQGDSSSGPPCRIALYRGDTPESVARTFAIANLLSATQEARLVTIVRDTLDRIRK